MGYAEFISKSLDIIIIEHINYEGSETRNDIVYTFFKSRNKFLHIPVKTLLYIWKEKPEVVMVQGNIFPLQLIAMSMFLPAKSVVIVQHHGNLPFKGIKKIFQQIADKYTDAYLFTTMGNVKAWLDNKIIKSKEKCFEVVEGSSYFKKQDKQESRALLQIEEKDVFLWVGRLDAEKGPITVLKGFEKYLNHNANAKLYMIYQAEPLLKEVTAQINNSTLLKNAVKLVGKVPHEQLEYWYSAADFYLSGSHREGSGFALIEALACGCVPIITDIPPYRKIVGEQGFLFKLEDAESLYAVLLRSSELSKEELSSSISVHFQKELTFKAIADNMLSVINRLTTK